MRPYALALLAALVPCTGMAQDIHSSGHAHDKQPVLGVIAFPNSGGAKAQEPFLRGIALLHSFEYDDAARAFREAQKANPSFALAYWAEALTYSHVVWRFEDIPASRAVLARLAPTRAARLKKARSDGERAFGAAVEDFYEDGTLAERVTRYATAMRRYAAMLPDQQEPAAFASHALMVEGFMKNGPARDSLFREAIALSQRVLAANPEHPGATHYLIHLYDSPGMAREGLAFARAYDKIAPDAEHALHMPSHIYLQLGLWDDVARSNERAWAASRAGGRAGGADWHAFSWLHYAYLQQGRFRDAAALLDSARVLLADSASTYIDARYVLLRLQFQQNAETGRWSTPLPAIPAPALRQGGMSDRERGFREQAEYWTTVAAAMRRDTAMLAARSARYVALADSLLAAGGRPTGTRAVNALVIRALVADARGDSAAGHDAWRAAVEAEEDLSAFVGPPERVFAGELWMAARLREAMMVSQPSFEHTTAILDAIPALQNVLRMAPKRSNALRLLALAGSALGSTQVRDIALTQLEPNYRNADAEVRNTLPVSPR